MQTNCQLKNHPIRPYKSLSRTEVLPEIDFQTARSQSSFKPTNQINCYNFSKFQHFKQKPKTKLELPPIIQHTDKGVTSRHKISKLSLIQDKKKPNSTFKIKDIETQRVHYDIKKPSPSMKSTSNESKARSFSSEQVDQLRDWEILQVQTAPEKFDENIKTAQNNQEIRMNKMRQKNIEKCLIGHSKHLPFCLEKKKVTKRLSFAEKVEGNQYQVPFEPNLSNIIYKRQSKTFLDDQIEDLKMLLC